MHLLECERRERTRDDGGVKNVPKVSAVGSGMEDDTQVYDLRRTMHMGYVAGGKEEKGKIGT